MTKRLLDRSIDTWPFRIALLFSGLLVVPVLALGVLTTVIGGAMTLAKPVPLDLVQAVFASLSIGGLCGFIEFWRAHGGARQPDSHNMTATVLCLTAGIAAALAVAAFASAWLFEGWRDPWSHRAWVALPGLFAAANVVWAIAGVAWMQRLWRRYAEAVGRAFDGLPALLLFVALALAAAAVLTTISL